jgi:hypothetical protein
MRVFRINIGNISKQGLISLKLLIESIRKFYPDFKVALCSNKEVIIDGIDFFFTQTGKELPIPPIEGFSVHWKLYPPRLFDDSHEITIDNDIIFLKRSKKIDLFLNSTCSCLAYEGLYGLYGIYEVICPIKINSGIYGFPPNFDFNSKVLSLLNSEWKDYFDEQGLVAKILSKEKSFIITQEEIPIFESEDITSMNFNNIDGIHFVGLNRKSHLNFRKFFIKN